MRTASRTGRACRRTTGPTNNNRDKIVPFPPHGRQKLPAAHPIPREEFERLAELALDIVDRIVSILDEGDGDSDREDGGDAEPSLGAPENHHGSQVVWLRGSDRDLEA